MFNLSRPGTRPTVPRPTAGRNPPHGDMRSDAVASHNSRASSYHGIERLTPDLETGMFARSMVFLVAALSFVLVADAGPAAGKKNKKNEVEAKFKKLDTNDDNKLTRDEFAK